MNGTFDKKLLTLLIAGSVTLSSAAMADNQWSYEYNAQGLVTQIDGPRTDVSDLTQYSYDTQGRLIEVVNALGHTSQLSNFDLFGSPQTIIAPNGLNISLGYDALGRLTSRTLHSTQGDATTQYTYNAVGLITRVTLPDSSWVDYSYDPARRLTQVTNSLGESITFTLDSMGNRTEEVVKDNGGQITQQSNRIYDEMGRLLELVGASGQRSQFSYDVDSNLTGAIDGNNNPNSQAFDALHRLVSMTDAHNQLTQLSYDQQDNITSVTDPRGLVTTYEYDAFGRVTQRNSPDTGITTYAYDEAGNVVQSTDARGVVTTYEYDALNRMVAKRFGAYDPITFIYDEVETSSTQPNIAIGRLTQMTDRDGVSIFSYDDRGNLIGSLRNPSGLILPERSVSYSWDIADRLQSIQYPSGSIVTYNRNSAGQIESVQYGRATGGTHTIADQIQYQPFGGVKSLEWGNGVALNRTFDLDGRLTSQQVVNLQSLSYQYDDVSNITQLVSVEPDSSASGGQSSISTLFQYDGLNRLVNEQGNYGVKEYTYDSVGNRTQRATTQILDDQTVELQSLTYFDNSNQIENIDGRYVDYTNKGDSEENLVQGQRYSYSSSGRLAFFYQDGFVKGSYYYSGFGERVLKVSYGSSGIRKHMFSYDVSGQLLQETVFDRGGQKQATYQYIWLDNLPIAYIEIQYDGTEAPSTENIVYIHSDHLNTPRRATDSNQRVVWRWDSDAFGYGAAQIDPDGDTVPVNINLRFPGQYYDIESGLHYNYYRDYDPRTGRYIQSDPIGLQGGLNTYAYVGGNPLSYSDPLGLQAWGLNFGGGFTFRGKHYSLAVAVVADSNGTSGILVTPEFGGATKGGGIFGRALYASGKNTFDSLTGPGASVSGSGGIFSGSVSIPYLNQEGCDENGSYETYGGNSPVYELGVGRGSSQVSATVGNTYAFGRNTVLGDIGRAIGGTVYDLLH